MKKMKWLSAMLIAGLVAFTACSDDESKEVFSDLSPEQHKKEIENEGIALVQKLDAAKNLKTFDVIDAFFTNMDAVGTQPTLAVQFGLNEIVSLANGVKSTVNLKGALVEQSRATEMFAEEAGIFLWDAEVQDWELLETSSTEATFRFMIDGQDAEISVYDFTAKDATHQDEYAEMVVELPLTLNAHVKLNNVVLTSFSLAAEWHDDDTPKHIQEIITLEDFSFESELTNTSSTIGTSASFNYLNEVIYANGISVDGEFSYHEIFDTMPQDGSGMDAIFTQQVIEKSNIWFQLGNIKLEGIFDVKGFIDAYIDEVGNLPQNPTEEDMENLLVKLINEYAILYVRYADTKEIIAKGEFYLKEVEDYYGGTYNEPALNMVFGDGSKVTVDEFVNSGFAGLITEIENFVAALEASYGAPVQ
ncbi:hypothetical protein KDU71_22145 [Carboxylicivirga sediminis]|uniref:DUF4856 domain-containing protein n=1 Tax=Carboxylicivirga sediminis TaxID=2006564 RepID=A0A941J0T0_9BACT|nr:hypothetical protein [Carboxylicivirga sediminis]MBR8538288.1 hypothetical protein [Carboxylicivirga sediminis]